MRHCVARANQHNTTRVRTQGNRSLVTCGQHPFCSQNREIKTRVYGKRQTSDSRLRFLKINNTYTKMVQNNCHVYGQHKTTYHLLETANGKRQTRKNHGHVVTSAVCRLS